MSGGGGFSGGFIGSGQLINNKPRLFRIKDEISELWSQNTIYLCREMSGGEVFHDRFESDGFIGTCQWSIVWSMVVFHYRFESDGFYSDNGIARRLILIKNDISELWSPKIDTD